jgi:aryl-alcohol dehydrogenase-like predicted oxidoreductase
VILQMNKQQAIKGIREKVQLATKFGIVTGQEGVQIRGDPEWVRTACEASLKRLDVEYVDLYYQHRVDTKVPIEITVRAMKKLVEEGKVKHLGLSEASASEIRRAHAVHPITAVQIEWSLWTRDVEEDIIPTCRELGIAIVPYCPLGRGFFSNADPEADNLNMIPPRLSGANLEKNMMLRAQVQSIAEEKKCSLNQLALAWLLHKGNYVVPIPGTTKKVNLESNIGAIAVALSKEEIVKIEAAVPTDEVAGERSFDFIMKFSWRVASSPPLSSWKD